MFDYTVLVFLLETLLKFAGCIVILCLFWGFAELCSRIFE